MIDWSLDNTKQQFQNKVNSECLFHMSHPATSLHMNLTMTWFCNFICGRGYGMGEKILGAQESACHQIPVRASN